MSLPPLETAPPCLHRYSPPSGRFVGYLSHFRRAAHRQLKVPPRVDHRYALAHPVSPHSPTSSSGKHLRHARDHFVLLLQSASSPPPHILNYDTRSRNTPMESSRSAARDALMETIHQLEAFVPTAHMSTPITLHAVTPDLQEFQTTFGREVGTSLNASWHSSNFYPSFGLQGFTVCTTGPWYALSPTLPHSLTCSQVRVIAGELVSLHNSLPHKLLTFFFSSEYPAYRRLWLCAVNLGVSRHVFYASPVQECCSFSASQTENHHLGRQKYSRVLIAYTFYPSYNHYHFRKPNHGSQL